MASFTDTTPVSFNAYAPQWDTDLYAKQIAYKQGLYDQNVEKIQQTNSALDLLDIINETQKSYLNGKIQGHRDKLQSMAGADWSNNNLLSEVYGMATQITKDKVIQNGLLSTATARKEIAKMEKAKAEGKSDINNENYFMTKSVSAYANDKDVNATFKGGYMEHIDVNKLTLDAVKSVDPHTTITQMPYVTDANGKPIVKDGHYQVNTIMIEQMYKGKQKEQILNAINLSLTGNAVKQLRIDGWAKGQGIPPQVIGERITQNYKNASDRIVFEQLEVAKDLLSTTLSEEERKALLNKQTQYTTAADYAKTEYDSLMGRLSTDLDGVNEELYVSSWKNNMAATFSGGSESYRKFLANPIKEAQLKEAEYNFKLDKERFEQNMALRTDARANSAEARAQKKFELERDGKWPDASGKKAGEPYKTVESTTNTESLEDQTYAQGILIEAVDQQKATIKTIEDNLTIEAFRTLPQFSQYSNLSKDQILQAANHMFANKSPEEIQSIKKTLGDDLDKLHRENPRKYSPGIRASIVARNEAQHKLEQYTTLMNEASAQSGLDADITMGGIKPITLNINKGGVSSKVTISEKDQDDIARYLSVYPNPGDMEWAITSDSIARKKIAEGAEARLDAKFGDDLPAILANARGITKFKTNGFMPAFFGGTSGQRLDNIDINPEGYHLSDKMRGDNNFYDKTPLYKNTTALKNNIEDAGYLAKNRKMEKIIANGMGIKLPKEIILPGGNPDDRDEYQGMLSRLVTMSKEREGGNANPSFDGDKFISYMNEKDAKVSVKVVPGYLDRPARYTAIVSTPKNAVALMDISETDAAQLTKGQSQVKSLTQAEKDINLNPFNTGGTYKSTNRSNNPSGASAPFTAAYPQEKFPYVKKYTVQGDTELNEAPGGGWVAKIFIKNEETGVFQPYYLNPVESPEILENWTYKLTDADITAIIASDKKK